MIPGGRFAPAGGARGSVAARVARLAVAAAVALAPCGAGAQGAGSSAPAASAPSAGASGLEYSEPVLAALGAALGAYEEVRRELAADRLEGVPAAASRLAGALRRAREDGGGSEGEIPAVLEEAASLAESMAEGEDLGAVRAAFGELSRGILVLAGADSRLVEGRHVFACPMAETFGKWIQPMEEMENPYMGPAMLTCGFPTDWSVPEPAPDEGERASAPGSPGASGTEPEFQPGIPGLTMEDVRDQKLLWREIEELQVWERGDRISVAEFRSKVIEKTAHFLELDGAAADAFTATASEAVERIRGSFDRARRNAWDPGGTDEERARFSSRALSSDIGAAVTQVTSRLGDEPRHHLFAPECKKWLLRLAFGPGEAKEAAETRQARAGGS